MARWEGHASIRRVLKREWGSVDLDIKPDGMDWQWTSVPPERAKEALACGLAAISGGWKLYVAFPDDPSSQVLETFGLTSAPDQ